MIRALTSRERRNYAAIISIYSLAILAVGIAVGAAL